MASDHSEKSNVRAGHDADVEATAQTKPAFEPLDYTLTNQLALAAAAHGHKETRAGRFVLDPDEARREYGDDVASKLKLTKDRKIVLWPQPTDSPEDPQNWSERKKSLLLAISILAAFVPDFSSGIGIASLFALAKEYHTTTGVINNLTSNWSIFLLGYGGLVAVMLIRKLGRLPLLFWSQLIGTGFLIGCTLAPDLNTFAAMRCLQSFFSTVPQVTGLYTVMDLYPVHRQQAKVATWTFGFIVSPFVSPFLLGFLVARQSWRWAYAVGTFYEAIVLLLIVFFMEETMYDRHLNPVPKRPTTGLRYRIETLLGATGWKMRKYRVSWSEAFTAVFRVFIRPHMFLSLAFLSISFGFTIGINVTNAVFLGTPRPLGYGYSQDSISAVYLTPIVGTIIGEIAGRWLNRKVQDYFVKRNDGVLETEVLLYMTAVAMPVYVLGITIFGYTNQHHASIAGVIFGWGLVQVSSMVIMACIYTYNGINFPGREGEVSALVNLFRTMCGFAIPYFQVIWAERNGPLQTFGCEGAVVAGIWFLTILPLLFFGKNLRERYSMPAPRQ